MVLYRLTSERAFTAIEVLIASSIVAVAVAAVLAIAHTAPAAFSVDTERADIHQRLRVAQSEIFRDLVGATAIRPYRWGGSAPDPPGTFKPDTITAVGRVTRTYWLEADDRAGTFRLMSSVGGSLDAPVVDNVVALRFDYLGEPSPPASGIHLVPLRAEQFMDGPWRPDDTAPDRWDVDLLRIRAIVVSLRVQAGAATLRGPAGPLFMRGGTAQSARMWAPDVDVHFEVAPRPLNLELPE
jgi:prepilin-type N-terminal cleavage/methylation domain-containing protein